MRPIGQYLNENRDFVVYRNKAALSPDKIATLKENIRYFHLQGYSILNAVHPSESDSYCSELAAKVYAKSGLRLTQGDTSPGWVFPIDIYRHVSRDPEWIDVTQEYSAFFLDSEYLGLMEQVSQFEQFHVGYTQNMALNQQAFADRVNAIYAQHGATAPLPAPTMNYWSNKLSGRGTVLSNVSFVLGYWRQMAKQMTQGALARLPKRRR